jgi:hypothetical protein
MPDINIKVQGKIAQVQGAQTIVCGNSDYSAVFEFDSEWSDYTAKTARFLWRDIRTGKMRHWDAQFAGDAAQIPAVYGTDLLLIGVYAGDIRTTTTARVPCARCITDDAPAHDPPDPDVYAQLLDYLSKLEPESGGSSTGSASLYALGLADLGFYTIGIAEYAEFQEV